MNSVKEFVARWIQRLINNEFDENSIVELYDEYHRLTDIDRPELNFYIDKSLEFYVLHKLDFRNSNYTNSINKFVTDIITLSRECGRVNYVLDIPMITVYMKLAITSDDTVGHQHIYNLILNFLSEYRDNTSDDRCLLKIWHGLSELGYIQKSDSSHYVRSLKHRVYSAAFDLFGQKGYNNPVNSVKTCDTHTDLTKRDLVESLRYRVGVRVKSILDISKCDNFNLTVYEVLELIHCNKLANIGPRVCDTYDTAIGDKLSTNSNCAAIAAMLSTDKDYAAIEVLQSTYSMYYNLLLNILNDMDIGYWSLTYDKLESLLVTSTNTFSKTKSFDMYLISIVIVEIMKRVSNFGDIDNLNEYYNHIREVSCDDIIYTNNPADLRLVLSAAESDLHKKSYNECLDRKVAHNSKTSSFLESCGVELSHLDSMAGFLTEGFQVIPHTNNQDRNLAAKSGDVVLVNFMSLSDECICKESQELELIAQVARDNKDEVAITNNISVMAAIIKELSKRRQTNQTIKAINMLEHSVSVDRLTVAKLHKSTPRKHTFANKVYDCISDNGNIVVKL